MTTKTAEQTAESADSTSQGFSWGNLAADTGEDNAAAFFATQDGVTDTADDGIELPPPVDLPPDITTIIKPLPGTCDVCGDVIERKPGSRGRLPKTHPECRSQKRASASTTIRKHKLSNTEDEARVIVERLRRSATKGILILGAAQPFDAFCLMAGLPDICDALEECLVESPWLRKRLMGAQGGGAWVSLVVAMMLVAIPIMANHNVIIKSERIKDFFRSAPVFMMQIRTQVEQGELNLAQYMREQMQEAELRKAAETASDDGNLNQGS
jgi:hypothetical protein